MRNIMKKINSLSLEEEGEWSCSGRPSQKRLEGLAAELWSVLDELPILMAGRLLELPQ